MKMKPKVLTIAIASAVLGGTGVGLLVVGPMADASSRVAVESAPVGASGASTPQASRHTHLVETLAPLVGNGTISQSQADAVIAAIEAARPAGRPGGKGHGIGAKARKEGLSIAATTIGITVQELRTELKSGKTIAQVAAAHNVTATKVIDAMVAAAEARIDQAVTAGRLTADAAAALKTKVAGEIADRVNNGRRPGPSA